MVKRIKLGRTVLSGKFHFRRAGPSCIIINLSCSIACRGFRLTALTVGHKTGFVNAGTSAGLPGRHNLIPKTNSIVTLIRYSARRGTACVKGPRAVVVRGTLRHLKLPGSRIIVINSGCVASVGTNVGFKVSAVLICANISAHRLIEGRRVTPAVRLKSLSR